MTNVDNIFSMGFWRNVRELLEFKNLTRKELSAKCNIPKYTIDKGIERDSDVSAIVALKISYALDIPLETLLNIEKPVSKNTRLEKNEKFEHRRKLFLAEKYHSFLESLEKMPKDTRERFILLVNDYSKL